MRSLSKNWNVSELTIRVDRLRLRLRGGGGRRRPRRHRQRQPRRGAAGDGGAAGSGARRDCPFDQQGAGGAPAERRRAAVTYMLRGALVEYAAERLNVPVDISLARAFGVGPQIAALEKMARPAKGLLSGAIGAAVDAIGSALGGGPGGPPSQPIPRGEEPRLLFIWGLARIPPVVIASLTLTAH